MTDEELLEIEARCAVATPGHWIAGEIGVVTTDANVSERYNQVASVMPICDRAGHCYQDGTTAFIAHARTDVPALVAEVRRLQALIAESKRTLRWRKWDSANSYELVFDGWDYDPIAHIYDVDGLEWHWASEYDDGYCKTLVEAMREAEKAIPDIRPIDTIIRPEVKS